ncbi:MAG TPA: type IX secretion system membrane protein PorP/SprF [Bacteroidia bacterium]|jgi:type IX secretion system PorP/SprF family membrane protein|nr:type IX secretion system membrane protein PorP/SprF [Bacteroidia bacterium]
MKKISTLLFAASLGLSSLSFAQQDPQFTQFMFCKQAYNPAVVGTNGSICFDALFRQQWVSFPGAPKTGLFGFNMNAGNFGVGLTVMNDQIGFQNTTMARIAGAYHIHIGPAGILSIGVDAGIFQSKINGAYIAPQTLNDPSIPNNNNPTGPGSPNLNKMSPDFGGGIYYTIPNKLYIGVSSTHLGAEILTGGSNHVSSGGNTPTYTGYQLAYDVARHYYIMAGYTFDLASGRDALQPNVLVKTDAASTQLDVNLTYMYKKMIGLGVSYRLQDAVAPMVVYKSPFGLRAALSYDLTTSKIKGYSSGTWEISLGYCMKPKDKAKTQSHWNTRFFAE